MNLCHCFDFQYYLFISKNYPIHISSPEWFYAFYKIVSTIFGNHLFPSFSLEFNYGYNWIWFSFYYSFKIPWFSLVDGDVVFLNIIFWKFSRMTLHLFEHMNQSELGLWLGIDLDNESWCIATKQSFNHDDQHH